MAPSTESMFLTPVPQRRHAAVLDAGALDVDIQAPSHHAKEPRPSSQTPLKVLEGHTGAVTGLAFFPDGRRLVSSSTDRTLIIWDVSSTGKKVERKLTGHTDRINSVAVTPDGSIIASGSVDGTLRIWDGTSGNQIGKPIAVDQSGPRGVWGVSFSPEGQQIAATRGGRVMIWDLQTRTLVTALETYGGVSYTTTFSHDGSRIAADAGGQSVCVWDPISGEVIFDSLKGHSDDIRWTAFTPDGRQLLTASQDQTICRWDMQSGIRLGVPLTGHSSWIYDGVLSHDGETLATASSDCTVRFWNLRTGNQKSRFLQHASSVYRMALSRDHSSPLLATGGLDNKVFIWDIKAGRINPLQSSTIRMQWKPVTSRTHPKTLRGGPRQNPGKRLAKTTEAKHHRHEDASICLQSVFWILGSEPKCPTMIAKASFGPDTTIFIRDLQVLTQQTRRRKRRTILTKTRSIPILNLTSSHD
ncbi:hypothetical protein PAXINDRAFT_173117 [Paxillus involutus ATCC 200175]|uniref:Unplaced genomic scaffold PAXINscaffold_393, whole genome shotgun sequence n=1 Tax=Paxillus involutus ATCC 200175 TaxID=664439 RepID=A0A0C9SY38_PAXIN|nr:hypothetical protein PAXINDRAFT_173117 [Paxillus involutus ATCC 200175]